MKKPLTKSDVEALTKKKPAKRKVSDLIKAAGFKEVKGARYDKPKRKVKVYILLQKYHRFPSEYFWLAELGSAETQCKSIDYKTRELAIRAARRFWGQFGVKVEVVE